MNSILHSPHSKDIDELNPELSVILSSSNDVATLARAMDSLRAQDLPAEQYEVIAVVDGDGGDRLAYLRDLQATCSLRIIEMSHRRLAAALNEAVAAARGRIVLFANDNLVLHPGNFSAHLSAHESEERRIANGPILVSEENEHSLTKEWNRTAIEEDAKRSEAGLSWPYDTKGTTSYSICLETLRACGGFDEDLVWYCHNDLGIRLAKMGVRSFHEPAAISQLTDVRTPEEIVRVEAREKGKEEIVILRKHPELRPYSTLAGFADSPSWKWLALEAVARSPISPDVFLRPVFALANRLCSWPSMNRLALHLLRTRVDLSFLRGAAESVGWPKLQAEIGMRLPVFMYHHVGPPQPDSEPALFVSAARFEAHLRFLKRKGYRGIRASDWMSWVRDAKPLPEKSVLLTFDDAIAELNEHAFPVLERYGFNAVVFVPTNCVGKGNLWNHSLGYKWRPCLNAEQIRCWSMREFEFGAHSKNHPDLTQLNESELQDEIAGSRTDLERIAGSPVISFAYPYGHYNSAAAQCVAQHFDLGFTIEEGLNTMRTNRSLLRRCTVFEWDTLLDLELMLRLGWNPIRRLRIRQRVRGLKRRLRIGTH
jgi:peptidoglycan/xylan/chitin deacetylase (PgdA/CDA1 family)/glycosyltransferase involved in cell wall biosynthesis